MHFAFSIVCKTGYLVRRLIHLTTHNFGNLSSLSEWVDNFETDVDIHSRNDQREQLLTRLGHERCVLHMEYN